MSGKAQIRRAFTEACIKIVDRRRARLFKGQARAGKAQAFERALQHVERASIGWRDGRAADQIGGKLDGIEGHISLSKDRSRMFLPASGRQRF